MITRTIDRNFANMRLDRFLRKAFPEESLSVFFAVIRKKKVRVNGVVGKANQMLVEGDVVNIYENFKSVSEDDKKGESLPLASAAEAAPATPSSGDTPQRPDAKSATGFAKNKSTWGRHLTGAEKQAHWGAHELDLVVQTEDYVIVNKPSGRRANRRLSDCEQTLGTRKPAGQRHTPRRKPRGIPLGMGT